MPTKDASQRPALIVRKEENNNNITNLYLLPLELRVWIIPELLNDNINQQF